MSEFINGIIIGLFSAAIMTLIIIIYDSCTGDDTMEININVKVTTKDHVMGSDLGEFEKELKERIETALYIELKDDYIKNDSIEMEIEVE